MYRMIRSTSDAMVFSEIISIRVCEHRYEYRGFGLDLDLDQSIINLPSRGIFVLLIEVLARAKQYFADPFELLTTRMADLVISLE